MALAGKTLRFLMALVSAMVILGITGCQTQTYTYIWQEPATLEPPKMTQADAESVLSSYHGPYMPSSAINEAMASFEPPYTIESAKRGTRMAVWFDSLISLPGYGKYFVGWMDPKRPDVPAMPSTFPWNPEPVSPLDTRNGVTFFRTQDEAVAFAQAIYAKKHQLAKGDGSGGQAVVGVESHAQPAPTPAISVGPAPAPPAAAKHVPDSPTDLGPPATSAPATSVPAPPVVAKPPSDSPTDLGPPPAPVP